MIKAILTKPLDGHPEGAEREFDKADFEALRAMGAVRPAGTAVGEKAAPPVLNKRALPVENKAATGLDVRPAVRPKI